MSNTVTSPIERLWHTWSNIGLEGFPRGGYQVRAASSSLREVNSERVILLKRYFNYDLPLSTDRSRLRPDDAPRCLSLVHNGWERILIHNVYRNKDRIDSQSGFYFLDMLVGLPDSFTARDAIELWRSDDFWQQQDDPAKPRYIEQVYKHDLKEKWQSQSQPPPFHNIDITAANEFMPFVFQAFFEQRESLQIYEEKRRELEPVRKERDELNRKLLRVDLKGSERKEYETLREKKQQKLQILTQEPPHIYIAAPPDLVAYFIWALTRYLPDPELEGFTFSTYENDVLSKKQYFFVGTCLPPTFNWGTDQVYDVLKPECYTEGYALNCYIKDSQTQEYKKTQLDLSSPAAKAARRYTNRLRSKKQKQRQKLLDFRDGLNSRDNLRIEDFLEIFLQKFQEKNPTSIADCLKICETSQSFKEAMESEEVQEDFIDCIIVDHDGFREKLLQPLKKLAKNRESDPTIVKSMDELSDITIPVMKQTIKERNYTNYTVLFDLFDSLTPNRSIQLKLLTKLLEKNEQEILDLIRQNWAVREQLLKMAKPPALPMANKPQFRQAEVDLEPERTTNVDISLVYSSLTVDEHDFVKLLVLDLPSEWNLTATINFLYKIYKIEVPEKWSNAFEHGFPGYMKEAVEKRHNPTLLNQTRDSLNKRSELVTKLFRQLLKDRQDPVKWPAALHLFKVLASISYTEKMTLLGLLISKKQNKEAKKDVQQDQELNKDELEWILDNTYLTADENAQMLKVHGASYLEPTTNGEEPETTPVIIKYFEDLVMHDYKSKWSVIQKLLEDLVLESTLREVLKTAQLNGDQKWLFFDLCKPKPKFNPDNTHSEDVRFPDYVSHYPNATVLVDMFQDAKVAHEEKNTHLYRWLDLEKEQHGKLTALTVQKIINATCPDIPEKVKLIEMYGLGFISSQDLRPVMLEIFKDILKAPNRDDYKDLYVQLFEAVAGDKAETDNLTNDDRETMEQILKIANLEEEERKEFLKRDSISKATFCCHSETVLGYYEELVSKGERLEFVYKSEEKKNKVDISLEWIYVLINELPGDQNAILLRRIYSYSGLDNDERAEILEKYGQDILSLYPDETFWLETIKQYLLDFNFDRSPSKWGLAINFLKFLAEQPLPSSPDISRIARCWQSIVKWILSPDPMMQVFFANWNAEREFSESEREISPRQIAYDSRLRAMGKTLSPFIDSASVLNIICGGVKIIFTLDSVIILLEAAAQETGMLYQKHYQQKYDINILLPYIQYVPCLENHFPEITLEEQKEYTRKIWNKLLQDVDEKTIKLLHKRFQDYFPKVHDAWLVYEQAYEREHKNPKGGTSSSPKKTTLVNVPSQQPLEDLEQLQVIQQGILNPPPMQPAQLEPSTVGEQTQPLVPTQSPEISSIEEMKSTTLVPEIGGQGAGRGQATLPPGRKLEGVNFAGNPSPTGGPPPNSHGQQGRAGLQSEPLSESDVIKLMKHQLEIGSIDQIVDSWSKYQQTLVRYMWRLERKWWDLMKLACDFHVISLKLRENREILQGKSNGNIPQDMLDCLKEYCNIFVIISHYFMKNKKMLSSLDLPLLEDAHNYMDNDESKNQSLPTLIPQENSRTSNAVWDPPHRSELETLQLKKKNKPKWLHPGKFLKHISSSFKRVVKRVVSLVRSFFS